MIRIAHRINTSAQLARVPPELGVEIDLRSRIDGIILQHDPFTEGERFIDWLGGYRHRTIVLNVKEEGLEKEILRILREKDVEDFFFLDQSFPFLVKTAKGGERRCAVRVSEFETIETALALAGDIEWVWVDCFSRFPLDRTGAKRLKDAGFRLCVVSPELHGRMDPAELSALQAAVKDAGVVIDAVCTKVPDAWA